MKIRALSVAFGILFLAVSLTAQTDSGSGFNVGPVAYGAKSNGIFTIIGGGKTNYVPLWLSSSKLGNSNLFQSSGGNVGIGTTTPGATLDVNGAINAGSGFNLGSRSFAFGSFSNGNAFGGFAGNSTVTGPSNTAWGVNAMLANTTGDRNTATGYSALQMNTTNGGNTANGYSALQVNTGGFNTAVGVDALLSNTTPSYNTAIGSAALQLNTTGYQNTASGASSLLYNTTGSNNTAAGWGSIFSNTSGYQNTALGFMSLFYNTTGSNNTALGYLAGPDPNSTGLNNSTAIGAGAVVSQSNALVLGGTGSFAANVGIGTATPSNVFTIAQGAGVAISDGWTTYSSRRWKTNIQTLQDALAKIEQLRGVSYELEANGKHELGVIAEEIGEVVPEVVAWDKEGTEAQGVDYSRLTALLIESTKEQQVMIRKQQQQLSAQQSEIVKLRSDLQAIKGLLSEKQVADQPKR